MTTTQFYIVGQQPQSSYHSSLLTQFTNWAKLWVSTTITEDSNIPRKRKSISQHQMETNTRETDIRTRHHYEEPQSQIQPQPQELPLTTTQSMFLYSITCQKLRRHPKPTQRVFCCLGDIIHVRHIWDKLEKLIYEQQQYNTINTTEYLPPTKRFPFNPDRPGSLYCPKSSPRRRQNSKRNSFASSTIIYTLISNEEDLTLERIRVSPVRTEMHNNNNTSNNSDDNKNDEDDDDDDVPLVSLLGRHRM
ncbi:MAG: hypothetical protein EXX96DRAFT_546224 [Benjaminiella poitrasii]|nr:MAG: hypothetical protein EXX96DRAFT_546224 [Benjaminiella poitrasii]